MRNEPAAQGQHCLSTLPTWHVPTSVGSGNPVLVPSTSHSSPHAPQLQEQSYITEQLSLLIPIPASFPDPQPPLLYSAPSTHQSLQSPSQYLALPRPVVTPTCSQCPNCNNYATPVSPQCHHLLLVTPPNISFPLHPNTPSQYPFSASHPLPKPLPSVTSVPPPTPSTPPVTPSSAPSTPPASPGCSQYPTSDHCPNPVPYPRTPFSHPLPVPHQCLPPSPQPPSQGLTRASQLLPVPHQIPLHPLPMPPPDVPAPLTLGRTNGRTHSCGVGAVAEPEAEAKGAPGRTREEREESSPRLERPRPSTIEGRGKEEERRPLGLRNGVGVAAPPCGGAGRAAWRS